ncbi:helicase/secretion neighborhood TadE-like protein [Flavimobilis marinus]|uniref:Helicase/secretion neighborhood TadE-like protein n=1 Tax=Flavimobilis marinus TaxID=285351 RepID=A0A1I2GZ75_9MICO|nr:Rv3654c family TadE-like protein [Flavimobilis marinus]SFF22443.1 helicase/secretion neighborhood TadE-like protein [Flavimobilis marinus]
MSRAGDRGSGSVLVLAVIAVALALALGLGLVARAHVARVGAESAADLAALAAATALARGGDACATARDVATSNGAEIVRCDTEGTGAVQVEVSRDVPMLGRATAQARAGPSWLREDG